MANEVYANGMEIACKSGAGKTICAMPDVCFTPPENPATPPGVPVPYPNTGFASDTTEGSKTVKISDKEVMLKNKSYFKKSTGDEAGAAAKKGVISSKNTGKVYFIKWSMDVKFEGENVDRHLDMTTNNHGCTAANEAVPWPFIDKTAMKASHPCVKSGDVGKVTANCTPPPEDCFDKKCCDARKCMLVPGSLSPNKCCSESGKKSDKQMTPHHIIPVQDIYQVSGIRGKLDRKTITLEEAKEHLNSGNKKYDPNKAPAICQVGDGHGLDEPHGKIGRSCMHLRNHLPGDTYKYSQVRKGFAGVVAHFAGCDPACILKQMDAYHNTKTTGEMRKNTRLTAKGAEPYVKKVTSKPPLEFLKNGNK